MEPTPRPPFDRAICHELHQVAQKLVEQHPEVRSIITLVDYHGTLNDSDAYWFVQASERQPPTDDAVLGSLLRINKCYQAHVVLLQGIVDTRRREILEVNQALLQRLQELEKTYARPTEPAVAQPSPGGHPG